ncbi:MAG: ABC transporter permease [Planctomycetota bacterium]
MSGRDSRQARLATVGALMGAHVALYVFFCLKGWANPGELFSELWAGEVLEDDFFHLLLLVGNAVLAVVLLRPGRDLLVGAGSMFLIAAHSLVVRLLRPDSLTSGALLMVSIMILYVGVKVNTMLPARYWWSLVASYLALFFVFVKIRWSSVLPGSGLPDTGMANAVPLLLLFLLGLAACARSFRMLAYFWATVLSFTFCQPYTWEAALLFFVLLTAVFSARGRVPSPTAVVFLACGLALTLLVMFPVVTTLMGEPVFNIERLLRNPDFCWALGRTALTATISTTFLVLFAVPLAYAVSRLRFRGRTLLLSLLDVPIVVPQSVAGIMLVQVFGSNQYIGGLLAGLGLRFDGTWLGICLAQVFVALPFIARSSIAAFDAVPEDLEISARTLGSSSLGAFLRVSLPLASRGVFLGAVLAWARAAGEFGALIFIAQDPPTAPVYIWKLFTGEGSPDTAAAVAALLLFSLAMFFLLQFVSRALPELHGGREEDR